jgi:hypothetical protein
MALSAIIPQSTDPVLGSAIVAATAGHSRPRRDKDFDELRMAVLSGLCESIGTQSPESDGVRRAIEGVLRHIEEGDVLAISTVQLNIPDTLHSTKPSKLTMLEVLKSCGEQMRAIGRIEPVPGRPEVVEIMRAIQRHLSGDKSGGCIPSGF